VLVHGKLVHLGLLAGRIDCGHRGSDALFREAVELSARAAGLGLSG
jgi:hypothetical protein